MDCQAVFALDQMGFKWNAMLLRATISTRILRRSTRNSSDRFPMNVSVVLAMKSKEANKKKYAKETTLPGKYSRESWFEYSKPAAIDMSPTTTVPIFKRIGITLLSSVVPSEDIESLIVEVGYRKTMRGSMAHRQEDGIHDIIHDWQARRARTTLTFSFPRKSTTSQRRTNGCSTIQSRVPFNRAPPPLPKSPQKKTL